MKKAILLAASLFILLSCGSPTTAIETTVDISSAEGFFEMADLIKSGTQPTEQQWSDLFATRGYKTSLASSFPDRDMFLRNAMGLAFDPARAAERDSTLSVTVTEEMASDWRVLLRHTMLKNFVETDKNRDQILTTLRTLDGQKLYRDAMDRLSSFLVDPVDSLIKPIPVSIICMESDAFSLTGGIVWDANLFTKQGPQMRIDVLAHEMFHTYRHNFVDYQYPSVLAELADFWQNEGIADQIDGKTVNSMAAMIVDLNYPQSFMDGYIKVYNETPRTIKKMETLTLAFLKGEMDQKQFDGIIREFDQFSGHANGLYMSTLIKEAGLEKEMIATFTSPTEFFKLYNRAIPDEYKVGDEFLEYLASTE